MLLNKNVTNIIKETFSKMHYYENLNIKKGLSGAFKHILYDFFDSELLVLQLIQPITSNLMICFTKKIAQIRSPNYSVG